MTFSSFSGFQGDESKTQLFYPSLNVSITDLLRADLLPAHMPSESG